MAAPEERWRAEGEGEGGPRRQDRQRLLLRALRRLLHRLRRPPVQVIQYDVIDVMCKKSKIKIQNGFAKLKKLSSKVQCTYVPFD